MVVVITLSPRDYDAVLFDLDGVLTKTARVHASAWKKLFDNFLKQRATQADQPFVPFDIEPTTRAMSTASRVTMAWQPSSNHAGSNYRWVHPKTVPTCKA